MEELGSDLEYLSQPMKSAISGHEMSCSLQDCLNLNSISPHRQQETTAHFLSLPRSPCQNLQVSRKTQRVQKALPVRQAGTSLPQSHNQRREVSSDCQHAREWEDLGWHSRTFLFARERQGSTLCPAEFEQLSLRKVRRDYRGKTGSISEVVKGRTRYSSLQNTGGRILFQG